ncbi:MAG: class I SAM-dependent methyltransferase [Chloroflexi bacterium]|nr:class I SAM-dependent methyltransferase [Chloroflexota bacterium]
MVSDGASPARKSATKEVELPPDVDPARIIALIPIRPYHVVGEVQCGDGYFTIPLAKYLFDGKMYAVDSRPEALEGLKKKLEEVHLSNVERVKAAPDDVPLEDGTLDGLLLAYRLPASRDRVGLLRKGAGALKKGGWAAVIEWYKSTSDGPPQDQRLDEMEVQRLAREAGFRFTEKRDLNGRHYLIILRK